MINSPVARVRSPQSHLFANRGNTVTMPPWTESYRPKSLKDVVGNPTALAELERGALAETFSETGEFLSTFAGGRKLVVLDEADNLFGREDSGGIGAIVDTMRQTRQPIVLLANDAYELTR